MRLLDYLRERNMTLREFAGLVGVSTAQVHRIAHGKKGASLGVALRIAEATQGAVQPADLPPLPPSPAPDEFADTG